MKKLVFIICLIISFVSCEKEKPEVKDYAYTLKLLQHEWTPISIWYSPSPGHLYQLLPCISERFTSDGYRIIKGYETTAAGIIVTETVDCTYQLQSDCTTIIYHSLEGSTTSWQESATIKELNENFLVTIKLDPKGGSFWIDSLRHN